MLLKATRFIAILLAALTLGLGFCHLLQLPSRMGWDQYLWVGSTVQGALQPVRLDRLLGLQSLASPRDR